ncbi:hypothetical protein MOTT12_01929 [Mycobacterium intracellulare subsp. yongonense]|nr:hypothetical protein MOTT12_01929 [Mycobacterium intracellulare subsp. yongonense]
MNREQNTPYFLDCFFLGKEVLLDLVPLLDRPSEEHVAPSLKQDLCAWAHYRGVEREASRDKDVDDLQHVAIGTGKLSRKVVWDGTRIIILDWNEIFGVVIRYGKYPSSVDTRSVPGKRIRVHWLQVDVEPLDLGDTLLLL